MFITNNHTWFPVQSKENLVKHEKVANNIMTEIALCGRSEAKISKEHKSLKYERN